MDLQSNPFPQQMELMCHEQITFCHDKQVGYSSISKKSNYVVLNQMAEDRIEQMALINRS